MRLHIHLSAVLLAAIVSASSMILTVDTAEAQSLIGYAGDLNGDQQVDHRDVMLLTQYLTSKVPLQSTDAATLADMDNNGRLDATDLTLLKRLISLGTPPNLVYRPHGELIDPPVAALNPCMPSTGTVHIPFIAVDFPDLKRTVDYSAEDIWRMVFEPDDPNNPEQPSYPMESVTAYYERASFNRLHIEGEVFTYTAKYSVEDYVNDYSRLLDEAMDALDDEVDFSKFDTADDGVLNTILVALPGRADEDDWWPTNGTYTGSARHDGVKVGNMCVGSWMFEDTFGFNSTWIHELGHAMGLPDYYRYENYDNTPEDDYGRGLSGEAGWELMDDSYGDLSAFSMLMCGWYTDEEIKVFNGGFQTYTLMSSQLEPNCILIPRGDLNGYHSEYFIIESITPVENNLLHYYEGETYPCFSTGGVRILHCDAELWDGFYGTELKWWNHGQLYDRTNSRQRVLRLVNPDGKFYRGGSMIDKRTEGFAWYDENGYCTIDTGINITINSWDNGNCTITIRETMVG